MALKLTTFNDIVSAIREALGIQSSDTNATNKIKRLVNMTYCNEVAPFKRWPWLTKTIQLVHKPYYGTGTAEVTPTETEVKLTPAPNPTLGSFKNYLFSVDGFSQVYIIADHEPGSDTITLLSPYQETLNAQAHFKIWRNTIDLPTDAKETISVWHAQLTKPLDPEGPQELRKKETANPKLEGVPIAYTVSDFYDPSSEDAELEIDRFRQIRVWPSITAKPVTLTVDYIQEVTELVDDSDEPLIPIGDRNVLYLGAGSMAWALIARNETEAREWRRLYELKLSQMAGDRDAGYDSPSIEPKAGYLNNIRRAGLSRKRLVSGIAGSSSATLPSYLKDVVIDGATLKRDMLVDDGVLIDGRDISADGELLDNLAASVEKVLNNNTTTEPVVVFPLAEVSVAHFNYSVSRGNAIEAGQITLTTDGTQVTIAQGAIANIGNTGVTFSADIVGSNLRLLYSTTNTGSAALMRYNVFKWLGH